jgi:hypothetical protein
MLEKSIEYYHELNIRLLNNEPSIQRTLAKNELFDTNITTQQNDEILEIELRTNHVGGGNFLLYFQGNVLFLLFSSSHDRQLSYNNNHNSTEKIVVHLL